ncbi:DnaJ C-terminal domain-containing protein [Nocardia sp. NPDC057227]|uniref:DnaJ C-terminal domain-containing protein n=1 Tax=Nocardia sp. NPDC057227 TaxID=3346056 RepID=UPI0036370321
MLWYQVGERPSVLLAHGDPTQAGSTPALTPIAAPRPPAGPAQTAVTCVRCGQAVRVEIAGAAAARRRVAVWQALMWIFSVALAAFLTYMVVGTFTRPRDERPSEALWFAYLPLFVGFVAVVSRFERADGVRLLDREGHELYPAPDAVPGGPPTGTQKLAAGLLVGAGLLLAGAGIAAIAHEVTSVDEVLCGERVMAPGTTCAADAAAAKLKVGKPYREVELEQIANRESLYNVAGAFVLVCGLGTAGVGGYRLRKMAGSTVAPPAPVPSGPRRGQDAVLRIDLTLAECGVGAVVPVTVDTAVACTSCGGTGGPCAPCAGDGRVRARRTIQARIPPGVAAGQRIRLAGQGEKGPAGGDFGDLYLEVAERPHPGFTRDGTDLRTGFGISRANAVHGGPITVSTLLDGEVPAVVAPNTAPGTVITLTGLGMPVLGTARRGDLHVHLNVY